MRALVTGAAGFIGSNLVDRLLADGHQVVGIDNLSNGDPDNLTQATRLKRLSPDRFTFLRLDILAPELRDVVDGTKPDVVFHLAAQVNLRASVTDPQFDARNNVLGTINLCEASRHAGVQRIVYAASGGSRYGAPTTLPVGENCQVDPRSPYAVAKLAGELYVRAYAGMYGLEPICLALSNVYGPRQDPRGEAGVIAVFAGAIMVGDQATIYGDGSATRDYVYVDDVVDAFVRAAHAPVGTTGVYNIGTGKQTSVAEVHRLIAAVLDGSVSPCYGAARTGELHTIALDSSKAEQELGWRPAVDIEEGIERTVRWLRKVFEPDPAFAGA